MTTKGGGGRSEACDDPGRGEGKVRRTLLVLGRTVSMTAAFQAVHRQHLN